MAIEDTMAQLAHGQVFQSLPSIANDVQGFQLIEGNEDDSAAIGVLVALISNLVDYIPVVYRKGKIYNMDIMYIPELHQWLPTQDNWVTYLKSRRADLEAAIMPKNTEGAGKAGAVDLDIPLLKIIKTASEKRDVKYLERVGVPAILKEAKALLKDQLSDVDKALKNFQIPSAIELLKKCAASEEAQRIVATITEYPEVADAFVQYYSDSDLLDVANAVVHALKPMQSKERNPKGEVKILTSSSAEAKDLTDEQKAEILRSGAVIVDTRGIKPTRIYKTNKNASGWGTPSMPGVYELLKLDGNTLTAYVIPGPHYIDQINGSGFCGKNYIIPLDDAKHRVAITTPRNILGQMTPIRQTNLTGGYTLNTLPVSDIKSYLVVDIDGSVVELDNFKPSFVGNDTEIIVRANDTARIKYPNSATMYWGDSKYLEDYNSCTQERKLTQLVGIPAGGKLRVKGSTLYVPEKCRIYELSDEWSDERPAYVSDDDDRNAAERRKSVADSLATMDEFIDAVSRREKLLSIKIYNDDTGFMISDDTGNTTDPLNKRAAAVELVSKYAIAPTTANEMLGSIPKRGQERFLAKLAADANYMMSVEEKTGDDPQAETIDLDSRIKSDEDTKLILQRAGESGLKEVMDVTVLKLLSEDGSSVRMIQDLIPSFFSAMNSVGQILFMLRASNSMSEAYGEYRASEMEKQFAKLMQRLGDAVIVLQQGRIDDVKDLLEGPLSSTLG